MGRSTYSYTGKWEHKPKTYVRVPTGIIIHGAVEDRRSLKPGTVTHISAKYLICTQLFRILVHSVIKEKESDVKSSTGMC